MNQTTLGTIASLSLLSACSTIPYQEDVTGVETTVIVRKLRCEAGQALNDLTVELLRNPQFGANEQTVLLADAVERGDVKGTSLADTRGAKYLPILSEQQKQVFVAYTLSAVTFDFRFFIQENNLNGGTLNAGFPFAPDQFSLALTTKANLYRQTEKKFQVTNTFYSLHREFDEGFCDNIFAKSGNITYPITGRVGIDRIFKEYIGVDSMRTIYKADSKYSDTLTFTTTYGASAGPSLSLAQVPNTFKFTGVSAALSAERSDLHQVNLDIAHGTLPTGATFSKALALAVASRQDAAARSLANANFTRTQDLFILPGRNTFPLGLGPFPR